MEFVTLVAVTAVFLATAMLSRRSGAESARREAAEAAGRRWIGIDASAHAIRVARRRLIAGRFRRFDVECTTSTRPTATSSDPSSPAATIAAPPARFLQYRVTLTTDDDNEGAQRFYLRHGFEASTMRTLRWFAP